MAATYSGSTQGVSREVTEQPYKRQEKKTFAANSITSSKLSNATRKRRIARSTKVLTHKENTGLSASKNSLKDKVTSRFMLKKWSLKSQRKVY